MAGRWGRAVIATQARHLPWAGLPAGSPNSELSAFAGLSGWDPHGGRGAAPPRQAKTQNYAARGGEGQLFKVRTCGRMSRSVSIHVHPFGSKVQALSVRNPQEKPAQLITLLLRAQGFGNHWLESLCAAVYLTIWCGRCFLFCFAVRKTQHRKTAKRQKRLGYAS